MTGDQPRDDGDMTGPETELDEPSDVPLDEVSGEPDMIPDPVDMEPDMPLSAIVIRISDHTETLPGYQVQVNIDDRDIIARIANDDAGDIRFFDTEVDEPYARAEGKLPYWIEAFDRAVGSLMAWVKVDLAAGTEKMIYMYCGNFSAANESSAGSVFPYFDDWTADHTGDWVHMAHGPLPDVNFHHWWETTKTFTAYRALESRSMLKSWSSGTYDYSRIGWVADSSSNSNSVDHIIVEWDMKDANGATDNVVLIRLRTKNGATGGETNFVQVDLPDPGHTLSLRLMHNSAMVSYEWKNLDTGIVFARDEILEPSWIPPPDRVPVFFHAHLDYSGGIFEWLEPTHLQWGNKPYNGGGEWHTDYWFIRGSTYPEPRAAVVTD